MYLPSTTASSFPRGNSVAPFLYRLGRFAVRRRRAVVLLWIVVRAVVGLADNKAEVESLTAVFGVGGCSRGGVPGSPLRSQGGCQWLVQGCPHGTFGSG